MKSKARKNDDAGFILVTTLLILVILSLIGIAGTRNSSVELQIAGNDKTIKETFYDAESAALESGGLLNNEDDPDELVATRTSIPWLIAKNNDGTDPVGYDNVATTWQDNSYDGTGVSGIDDGSQTVKLAAVDRGILSGASASSLKITATSLHGYRLFGYATKNNGWKLIELGFKKRF